MGTQQQDAGLTKPSDVSATTEKSPADVMGLEAITFGYGLPLMRLGAKKPLEAEDIPPVPAKDRASVVVESLLQAWLAECSQRPKSPSLPRAIFKAFRHKILLGGFWCFFESAARIGQPVLIGGFLRALRRDDEAPLYSFAGALAVVAMLQSIVHHQAYYVNMTTGWNLRIALTGLLHWRMLRLRSSTLESASAGDWRNLVANDCQRFEPAWAFVQYGWLSFLDLAAVFILLVLEVSWLPTAAGTAVVFLFIVLMLSFAKQFARRRSITASITDKRLELMAQVLEAMMSIKIFCWESTFADRIVKIRKDEHHSIFKRQVLVAANSTMYYILAPLSSLALFLVLAATDEELSLASSYVVLSLLLALRISFGKSFARFSQSAPECYASSLRIQRFLSQPDVPAITISPAEAEQAALEVSAATFSWPDGGPTALPLVSLAVKQGELLVVAGPVGCGKSALLQGLLGELDLKQGSVVLRGSLAYAPQAPWIMAGTLQSNILFGLPLEPAWYQEVLEACCLLDDVQQLGPQGDLTEIGERGVNLSGGQRARVGLARAVYARPAICLLDDPLSAVDPAVSRHLISQCLKGSVLAKTAVVLCTHQASIYSLSDRMLLLGESGTVRSFGTPSEVAAQCDLDLIDAQLPTKDAKAPDQAGAKAEGDSAAEDAQEDADGPQEAHQEETREPAPPNGLSGLGKSQASLVKAEDKKKGGIGWRTYLHYMQLAGVSLSTLVFSLFVLSTATMVLANYWLGLWAQAEDDGEDGKDHAIVFACLTAATVILACLRSVLFYAATLRAASSLHSNALNSVLGTHLSFFTSNPLGRVLNRFSGDLNNVDEQLSEAMHEVADLGFTAGGALVVICVAVPPVIPGFAVMLWYMLVLRRFVVKSMTELKRWDTVTRSPVLDCFTSLKGLACIRAFQREDSMHAAVLGLLETNAKAWYWWLITNRFIGFRLDSLCVVIVAFAAFGSAVLREFMPPELAALAVANAVGLAGVFQFMVRQSALVESYMASFERLETYSILPPEVDEGKTSPPEGFPVQGTVQMEGVRMRYREDLPEVLKGVDFVCPGGAKAGLVGRTGSGKSSLFMAVSRLAEITEGTVRIDGVDVSTMPLSTLRRCIAWVPQEPSFFSGSLRMNLDPLCSHTDDELLQALRQVQMESVVQANGLDSVIAERGSNYSVGERQLLSLARALLQKRRILCMDEAFANVDFETDQKVQEAVRMATDSVKATVLVIAHRLQSIANSDYIVVMDNGRVAECGDPKQLLLRHQDPQNRGDGKVAEGASYAALLGGHA